MAVIGGQQATRYSFKAGDGAKTTTSQYKLAYISASMTVSVPSVTAAPIIGLIESYQSSNSEVVSVITAGIAKGVMRTATTCAIGALLVADVGGLGTLDTGITDTTAQVIVGRALNVPVTGGAVIVMLNTPFLTTDLA